MSSSCSNNITTDHTVLIVGRGTYVSSKKMNDDDNTEYYIVRNSWGTDWGIEGYMRIAYDTSDLNDGVLGIQQEPKYV